MTQPESSLTRADTDRQLIEMWLHGRPEGTQANYRSKVEDFRVFLNCKPLRQITLEDVQAYQTYLDGCNLKDSTKKLKINAVKSLFTFATRLNYLPFNVAAVLRMPKVSTTLAGRILRQTQVIKMLSLEPCLRNAALLKLMYVTGARVSEICRLRWEDFQERDGGSIQVRILGKGGKRRVVLVPVHVWLEVEGLRGDRPPNAPVFAGRAGKPLTRGMAHHIIKEAAKRSGLDANVSCHWLRHAHAQHSLAKGAPLPLVRDSLGHSSIAVTNVYLESNPEDSSSKYLGF